MFLFTLSYVYIDIFETQAATEDVILSAKFYLAHKRQGFAPYKGMFQVRGSLNHLLAMSHINNNVGPNIEPCRSNVYFLICSLNVYSRSNIYFLICSLGFYSRPNVYILIYSECL